MNLEKLFDFQKFENNSRLAKLISETESRYAKALSDDDLDMVNAAGDIPNPEVQKEQLKEKP